MTLENDFIILIEYIINSTEISNETRMSRFVGGTAEDIDNAIRTLYTNWSMELGDKFELTILHIYRGILSNNLTMTKEEDFSKWRI